MSIEVEWEPAPCEQCGELVRVDPNIRDFDPRPTVLCAFCWPWSLLPDDIQPEDF